MLVEKTIRMLALAVGMALLMPAALPMPASAAEVTPTEARAIAKEAYIYGFPIVDNYRIQHAYFVDSANPEYKGPWNTVVNVPRVYT
ncbi:MAG: hypothetical protein ACREFM_10120, partial [Hypericibacter sp.]